MTFHLSVKRKLVASAIVVSSSLLLLAVLFFLLSDAVQTKLDKASELSQKAVASSDGVEETLSASQNDLNAMAIKLNEVTEPMKKNKQRLAILDRKSQSVIDRITELQSVLQTASESMDEDSDALYEIEDAIYELEDIQTELQRELQANIQTTAKANNTASDDVISGANELTKLNADFQNAFESLMAINLANTSNNQSAILTIENASKQNQQSIVILTITIAVITILLVGVVLHTIVLVTRPLDALSEGIEKVSHGDFTTEFVALRQDEFGKLSDAMSLMVKKIKEMIQQVSQESEELLTTAGQMEANSKATQKAIEKEQDEVNSVVAATNQMLQAVKSVTKASNQSLLSSQESSQAAQNGVDIVQENIRQVKALGHEFNQAASVVATVQSHTEEIDSILSVIKDITDQTNLLALNAAIEAARAGEQGRGFAVVADEVRQLAIRTQNSTAQITEIIQGLISSSQTAVSYMKNSEKGVADTTKEAEKINSVFGIISSQVNEISSHVELVATASEEQTQVSEQVQLRMESIESESRHIYTMADEVVLKSSSLKELSQRIANHMQQFKITE